MTLLLNIIITIISLTFSVVKTFIEVMVTCFNFFKGYAIFGGSLYFLLSSVTFAESFSTVMPAIDLYTSVVAVVVCVIGLVSVFKN